MFLFSQGLTQTRTKIIESLLPSRFAQYNELSDHFFLYALENQANYTPYEALGRTLLHVAGMRTLYDPPPLPAHHMPSVGRIAYATLDMDTTLDRTHCVLWIVGYKLEGTKRTCEASAFVYKYK